MDKNSKVNLKLSIQKQKEDSYIIGSNVNSVFIEVPGVAVEVVKACDGKRTIEEVQDYLIKEKDLELDVLDFLETLEEMELVYSVDGNILIEEEVIEYPSALKKLSNILFNKYSAVVYMILFITNIVLAVSNKNLFPSYKDVFFIEDRAGLNMLILFAINWSVIVLHEFGHYLSVVRLGVKAKFNLSLRMLVLVVEADINGLWSVEKEKRYFSYFAGMCVEVVITFIALLMKLANINSICNNIAAVVILVNALSLLTQFMIFLRTDLYLVLLTYFNMSSLYEYSKVYIKNKLFKNKDTKILEDLDDRERKCVKLFSLTYIIGAIFSVAYLCYQVPIMAYSLYSAIIQISTGNLGAIIDSMLVIIIVGINLWLWIKGAINRRKSNEAES